MTGKDFKSARQSLGLSVSGLAEALGCGKRTIMRIEADGPTRMAELAMERLTVTAESLLLAMTSKERLDVFDEFCRSCGGTEPRCQCWNDE